MDAWVVGWVKGRGEEMRLRLRLRWMDGILLLEDLSEEMMGVEWSGWKVDSKEGFEKRRIWIGMKIGLLMACDWLAG